MSSSTTEAPRLESFLRQLASTLLPRLRSAAEHHDRLEVSSKTAAYDVVTEADRAIEALVWEEIRRVFPGDGFLGEERGWRSGPTGLRDWVVDPIDGTSNFVNGLPWACASVAALDGGAAHVGLVIDPYRNEVYLTVGGTTELNGETVQVAGGADLAGKVVLLEVPSGTDTSVLGEVEIAVHAAGGSPRVMGSGALALAMVASGRAQAVVHAGPSIWDVAGGVALVEHAGGVVAGRDGPYRLGTPGPLVAGSAGAVERLRSWLHRCAPGKVADPASLVEGLALVSKGAVEVPKEGGSR